MLLRSICWVILSHIRAIIRCTVRNVFEKNCYTVSECFLENLWILVDMSTILLESLLPEHSSTSFNVNNGIFLPIIHPRSLGSYKDHGDEHLEQGLVSGVIASGIISYESITYGINNFTPLCKIAWSWTGGLKDNFSWDKQFGFERLRLFTCWEIISNIACGTISSWSSICLFRNAACTQLWVSYGQDKHFSPILSASTKQ